MDSRRNFVDSNFTVVHIDLLLVIIMNSSEIITKMVRKLCRPLNEVTPTLFHILLSLPFKVREVLPFKVKILVGFFYLTFIISTVVRSLLELELSPQLTAGSLSHLVNEVSLREVCFAFQVFFKPR